MSQEEAIELLLGKGSSEKGARIEDEAVVGNISAGE